MNFAVVPACGHSTRMGRPKLALPLGGGTVIEHVVATLRDGGVDRVLVVIGPHVPELVPLATAARADVLALTEPMPDMRATVERGLSWLEELHHPAAEDCWLLAPADHPGFSSVTVRQLLAADSSHSIIVTVHQGKRGHPTLFRWKHVAGIRALPPGEGINSYLRQHADETCTMVVTDAGICANLDTPEDYERLLRAGQSGNG
jgi:CTP:molybdopterin cytidylyltransferase MocA